MTLHVYRARNQPATRYRVELAPNDGVWIRSKPRALLPCFDCRKKHYAKNLLVHVYYDGTYFFCRPGKGCKVVT